MVEDFVVVTITKGDHGLGVDLMLTQIGTVHAHIARPYVETDASVPHPADAATPPLMDDDMLVAVNAMDFGKDFEKCKELIRSAGKTLKLTVNNYHNNNNNIYKKNVFLFEGVKTRSSLNDQFLKMCNASHPCHATITSAALATDITNTTSTNPPTPPFSIKPTNQTASPFC